jgi:hypothetical protein
MAQQAMDTFMAVLKDGSQRLVTKGEVLPDGHELVKRDQDGGGQLFRKLDLGEEKPAAKVSGRAKSDG